jgi:hypothetical protein
MSEPINDSDLAALQSALARLNPAADGINVGQLMFRAGQASVPPRSWAWPAATVFSLLLTAILGVALALRPGPQVLERERIVTERIEVPQPGPSSGTELSPAVASAPTRAAQPGAEASDSLKLRQLVLTHGLDALPAPAPWPAAASRPRNLATLLDLPADAAQEPWFRRLQHSLPSGDAS